MIVLDSFKIQNIDEKQIIVNTWENLEIKKADSIIVGN